ncbi:MAG: F0F1 ATP synthase subunit B [Devosiaceae bacterium]|nr:F0F1 ATP synthase subunit B [Devosiaceae bacterium MH13]
MATTEDAAHGAAEAAAGVFPPFDSSTFASQLFWLVLTFGITYYVISKIAGPRISGILEDRHDRIASDLAEAERLKRETDEAMSNYEQALADARSRAQAVAAETRDKLTAETTAKREASEADLNSKLAEAETRIADIKAQALSQVDSIAAEAAEAILGKLAPTAPKAAAVTKAISDISKSS